MSDCRVITVPNGRQVTIGAYLKAWKLAKSLPPSEQVWGWQWFPVAARDVLEDIRRGIHERINEAIPRVNRGVKMRVRAKRDILFLHGVMPAGTILNVISLGACTDDGRGVSGLSIDAVEFIDGVVNAAAADKSKTSGKPPWSPGQDSVKPLPGQKTLPELADTIVNEYIHEEFRRLKRVHGDDVILLFKTTSGHAVYNLDCGRLMTILTAAGIDHREEHARVPHVHRVRFPSDRLDAVVRQLMTAKLPFASCEPSTSKPGVFTSTSFKEVASLEDLATPPATQPAAAPADLDSLDDLDL